MVLLDDSIAVTPQWVLYMGSPGSQLAVLIAQTIKPRFILNWFNFYFYFNFVLFLVGKARKNGILHFAWVDEPLYLYVGA
jgi:hypothetical protein